MSRLVEDLQPFTNLTEAARQAKQRALTSSTWQCSSNLPS
jgi:hypothetical protein